MMWRCSTKKQTPSTRGLSSQLSGSKTRIWTSCSRDHPWSPSWDTWTTARSDTSPFGRYLCLMGCMTDSPTACYGPSFWRVKTRFSIDTGPLLSFWCKRNGVMCRHLCWTLCERRKWQLARRGASHRPLGLTQWQSPMTTRSLLSLSSTLQATRWALYPESYLRVSQPTNAVVHYRFLIAFLGLQSANAAHDF